MATVSSLGISGLPLDDLLTSLRQNENRVLSVIQGRQVAAESRLSAYGKLKDAVTSFQKAAEAVGKSDAFGAIAAKSSSEALSVTATNQAITGQYAIQIDTLASAQSLVAAGRADRTTDIGTGGTVSITLGNGDVKTLDLSGKSTSLNGLVQAINADPDLGFNATLVNDGGDTPHRLVLTSRETGTQAAATRIEVSGNTELQAFLGFDQADPAANLTEKVATNAALQINGIQIQSQTNTIENALDGVTLILNQTTDTAATLTLSRDDSSAKKAIEEFVKAYNSLQGTIKTLTSYDVDNQQSSPLTGDSLARSVQTRMRDAISSAFAADGTNLSSIGINTDPKTGELQIDSAKLDKALAENLDGIKSLFSDGATGLGKRAATAAETFTRSGGVFSTTTESLNRTIADIRKQFDATADRIDQRMETYRNQFTQLDSMVTQMNSLSSYLAQQLSALSSLNSSTKN